MGKVRDNRKMLHSKVQYLRCLVTFNLWFLLGPWCYLRYCSNMGWISQIVEDLINIFLFIYQKETNKINLFNKVPHIHFLFLFQLNTFFC